MDGTERDTYFMVIFVLKNKRQIKFMLLLTWFKMCESNLIILENKHKIHSNKYSDNINPNIDY